MFYSGNLNTEFEPLTNFNEYEIKLVDGNAKIRRISDGFEPKYTLHKYTGYYQLRLSKRYYYLHRIIAEHYIKHDNKHNVIDHIDRNRQNYHIMNLRWTTQQDNTRNKSSFKGITYQFVSELPKHAKSVTKYLDRIINNVYYCDDVFYFDTGVNYRILHKHINKDGSYYVNTRDSKNKVTAICINKLVI